MLQKKALASDLYEQVFYSLDLIEKDYFGLQYTDSNNVQHWLDPTKPIKKQVKSMFFAYLYSFSFLFIYFIMTNISFLKFFIKTFYICFFNINKQYFI